jgi:hypothetical protein
MERVRELSYEDMEEDWPDAVEGELDTIRGPRLVPFSPSLSHFFLGFQAMGQRAGAPRIIARRSSVSSYPKPPRSDRQPPAPAPPATSVHTSRYSVARKQLPRQHRVSCPTGNESDYLKSRLW